MRVENTKYEKTCPVCGEAFQAKRTTAVFCSSKCRLINNRSTKSEAKNMLQSKEIRKGFEKNDVVRMLLKHTPLVSDTKPFKSVNTEAKAINNLANFSLFRSILGKRKVEYCIYNRIAIPHEKTREKNRYLDSVAYVRTTSKEGGHLASAYLIGFEVKVMKEDLMNDDKFKWYMSWADQFFFVVPSKLVKDAVQKSDKHGGHVGVIDAEKQKVIKPAQTQILDSNNRIKLLELLINRQNLYIDYDSKSKPKTKKTVYMVNEKVAEKSK